LKKKEAVTKVDNNNYLVHKICSYAFTPTKAGLFTAIKGFDDKQCKAFASKAQGNMYLVSKGKCVQSFKYAEFDADIKHDKKTGKVTKVEWELEYKSLQKCAADNTKDFKVEVKGTCTKDKKSVLAIKKAEKCKVTLKYTGKDACVAATFPLQKYMNKIAPFTGIVLILGGLAVTFFGSKFVPLAIAFLSFLGGAGGIFMVGYNFLPPTTVKMWSLIVLLVVAALLGLLIAWLTYKFLQAWSIAILGGWLGIVLVLFILKMAGVKNQNIVLGCALLAAVLAGFFSNKFKVCIKKFGTAFIGAFIVVRGVASYAGGFPSEFSAGTFKDKSNGGAAMAPEFDYGSKEALFVYAYLAGFLVLGIVGVVVQAKFIELPEEEENKDDEFKNQDESKVCGCF